MLADMQRPNYHHRPCWVSLCDCCCIRPRRMYVVMTAVSLVEINATLSHVHGSYKRPHRSMLLLDPKLSILTTRHRAQSLRFVWA